MPMNPDLEKERQGGTFDVEQLTHILDGGRDKTLKRHFLEQEVLKDPVFRGPDTRFLSREELFGELLRKHVAVIKKTQELSIDDINEASTIYSAAMNNNVGPLTLHSVAFVAPLDLMADDEQKKKWLIPAKKYEIIGCYAQTELGHGSFIRGLETRADYDVNTQQFVLNTPTETAIKWWVGGLGITATHAIVMAQLYVKGRCHGLHPFMVPLRDIKTHKLFPGVAVGDIGPKFGFGGVDNGYLCLNNVRIPRDNLLAKTGKVLEDGTYVKPENPKVVYGSMLGIRAALPKVGAYNLSKAVTIAIRYSCVRHQSEIKPGCGEPQVLDYQTQQHKLFPLLATAYAFHTVGVWMLDFHSTVMNEINEGHYHRLAEDHVLAAGLKAVINWKTHEGIEICRFSCGGHGYSLASSLPVIYVNHVANSTAEGETVILLLQTAVYLMKCVMDLEQGTPLDPSVAYLDQSFSKSEQWCSDVDMHSLLKAIQFRSKKFTEYVSSFVKKELMATGNQQLAFNKHKVILVECAKAHTEAVIMNAFVTKVDEILQSNPSVGKVLSLLCQIYGVTEILAHSGDYIQYEYLRKIDLDNIQDQLFKLYTYIRPEAVLLVDAFDFHDEVLKSILGRYDGQVYENMFKWAKASPFNKQDQGTFRKYIQQLKQAKL